MPETGEIDPGMSLGYTVVRLGHVVAARFESALKPHGLTLGQYSVLAHLARRPALAVGELARIMAVTAQSVGVMLDTLQDEGLVSREPRRPGYRRLTTVTDAGLARLAAATPDVDGVDRSLDRALPVGHAGPLRETLFELLRRTLW